jgi:hypothetical protein
MTRENNAVACRVYAETLSPREAASTKNLALLSRWGCDLVLAVRPPHKGEIAEAVARIEDAGLAVALWPMIEDERGRWPSARNASAWIEFSEEVIRRVENGGAHRRVKEVLFDLEPPFGTVRALTPGHFSASPLAKLARPDLERGTRALVDHRESLRARGVVVSAAVVPLCVFSTHWERALGTPVRAIAPDLPSVMAYTTIYEGWSRRVFSRSDALALLDATTRFAVRHWGARAGVSLGTVGTGAFEDEPTYRSPDEVRADAWVARDAGARALTLFDLGGVVRRGPADAWLAALTEPARDASHPRVPVATSRRMALFVRGLSGGGERAER